MAQFLIPLAMGIPSLISGIMDAVHSGKKLTGGQIMSANRLMRHPIHGSKIRGLMSLYRKMRPVRGGRVRSPRVKRVRRGRGIAADIASAIPFIGPLAGPLVRAFGGRVRRKRVVRRGRGLVPMHIYQPIAVGAGLLGPGAYRPSTYGSPMPIIPYGHSMKFPLGKGLLSPTGMGVRRGHYRYVNGKRVHVKPTVIGGAVKRKRVVRRRLY